MQEETFLKIVNNIEIVLVSPQVPENIGLVARNLKNTAFKNLSLVSPNLTKKSYEVAKGARDILKKAKVFSKLEDALTDSNFVFGTTRRRREFKFIYNFNQIKNFLISLSLKNKVSIIFGREDFGLSSEEIELCDSIFYIPANEKFPSYNLAFACGVVCYELFSLTQQIFSLSWLNLSKKKEINSIYNLLERLLAFSGEKKYSPLTLRRLLSRCPLTKNETSFLKGILIKFINLLDKQGTRII